VGRRQPPDRQVSTHLHKSQRTCISVGKPSNSYSPDSGRGDDRRSAGASTHAQKNYQEFLKPVDRAEEIPLADRHTAMTQDVVRRCDEEEEIRQGELLQIVAAF
jgi:hypothetical protein